MTAPDFTGTAKDGSKVMIFTDGTAMSSGVGTGGSYDVTVSSLPEGTHSITATATDAAGNGSTASAALSVTIDTTAPVAPSVPDLAAPSGTGTSNSDNITSVITPTFIGTAEDGAVVAIFADGVAVDSAIAKGGTYSVATTPLDPGLHAISAVTTDAAGNQSTPFSPSTPLSIRQHLCHQCRTWHRHPTTGHPKQTTLPTWLRRPSPVRRKTAPSSSYLPMETRLAQAPPPAAATASRPPRCPTAHISSRPRPQMSRAMSALRLLRSRSPSNQHASRSVPAGRGVGFRRINTDDVTNVVTPTFTGSAEAGSTVTIFSNGVAVGSGVATAGSYSIITALSEGVHNITAEATDQRSNRPSRIINAAPPHPSSPG